MLVITRNIGGKSLKGTSFDVGEATITILGHNKQNHQVMIGIDAPKNIDITRDDAVNRRPRSE